MLYSSAIPRSHFAGRFSMTLNSSVGVPRFLKDIVQAFTAAFWNIDCASLLLLMLVGIRKAVYFPLAANR